MKRQRKRYTIPKRIISVLCSVCILWWNAAPQVQAKDASTSIAIGIDVSRYQGDINWGSVAASGVSYAFVRVGSVKYGVDVKFDQNMRQAAAAGIRTGVYLYSYARSPEEAAAEAQFVLSAIANYTVNMPVVIDIEDSTQKDLSPEQLALIANTFCSIVENAGYYPMVYANKNWFTTKIGGIGYDRWVAQYHKTCDIEDAAFWQATSTGLINGIGGYVDIDYQYRDLSASIVANGFVYRKGFYYFYENYKMRTASLISYNGGIYYVDQAGRRVSGFAQLGSSIHYFNEDGLMLTGWQTLGGQTYYFDAEGKMALGLVKIGDYSYMFDANGWLYRGWLASDHVYYFYEDGHMATGLSLIGTECYLFDENGYIMTGWQTIDGLDFYFNPVGGMRMYGFINDGTGIYYTDSSGVKQTGLTVIEDAVYYLGEDGRMCFGWQTINGADYYFDPVSGKMLTGFAQLGADTYYFDPASGIKQTGWTTVDGAVYYLGTDGIRYQGIRTVGEAVYYFDVDGKLRSGFISDGVNAWYFDPTSGAQVRGFAQIDGATYFFDMQDGTRYVGLREINGGTYLFDIEGKMQFGWQDIGDQRYYFGADGIMQKGLINDGTGVYYLDPADGHLYRNTVVTIGEQTYTCDQNGHLAVAATPEGSIAN